MTKEEYRSWVNPFLFNFSKSSKKLFIEVIGLADILMQHIPLHHHIESSFNNYYREKLIKVIHLFRYPCFSHNICSKDLINHRQLLKFIRKLNVRFGTKFNIPNLEFLLSLNLSQGKKNDLIALSFDFIPCADQLDKLSLYINPYSFTEISKFLHFLMINKYALHYWSDLLHFAFIGCDFLPQGQCLVKQYREKNISNIVLSDYQKSILDILQKIKPIEGTLEMSRLNNKGIPLSKKYIYFYMNGLKYSEFLNKISARAFIFIKKIKPYVERFRVIWIAVKEKMLEVYFT